MKTLIGIITFGNLPFTQLAIHEIKRTTKAPVDFFVVVGKPDDTATGQWLAENKIPFTLHEQNWGMPYSCNDIYDHAFVGAGGIGGDYAAVIFVGNDVVVYPGAIDAMIAEAAKGQYDWVAASEYAVRSLCRDYPEARPWFHGERYAFHDFTARPWDLHANKVPGVAAAPGVTDPNWVQPDCRKDTYNLCLYTRRSFAKLGYMDSNFWPSGYFGDNDWGYRGDLAGVRACGLRQACYFHFWSRTIHQGTGTTALQFERNRAYFMEKWGGLPGAEKFTHPFNAPGQPRNIETRVADRATAERWLRK